MRVHPSLAGEPGNQSVPYLSLEEEPSNGLEMMVASLAIIVMSLGIASPEIQPHLKRLRALQEPQAVDSRFTKLVSQARGALKKEPAVGPSDVPVSVDTRIHLLSIIFRLAGNDEFGSNQFGGYAEYVDKRFKSYASHPAVQYAQKLRQEKQISGDAVACFAIHLSEKFEAPSSFEGTRVQQWWRPSDAKDFAALVREFAKDSRYSSFLEECRPIHELVSVRMRGLVNRFVDLYWYDKYFGRRPQSKFIVAASLLQGAISFGVSKADKSGNEQLFAVMGTWSFDELGLPRFNEGDVGPVIIHEFLHSYIDPSVGRHQELFRPVGPILQSAFKLHLPQMSMFYWRTLFEESLIRAAVVRYLQVHRGEKQAKRESLTQMGKGFVWTESLADLLIEYERNRSKFARFEDFFPAVVEYFTRLPEQLPAMVERLDVRRPKIIRTSPAVGALDVDPNLSEIQVHFDRPMDRGGSGCLPPIGNQAEFPTVIGESFDIAGRILTIKVRLKANTNYEIRLNSDFANGYCSEEGIPLKGFRLQFRTRDSVICLRRP